MAFIEMDFASGGGSNLRLQTDLSTKKQSVASFSGTNVLESYTVPADGIYMNTSYEFSVPIRHNI